MVRREPPAYLMAAKHSIPGLHRLYQFGVRPKLAETSLIENGGLNGRLTAAEAEEERELISTVA